MFLYHYAIFIWLFCHPWHFSHFFPLAQASKFIGTLQYMAPEVVIARGDDFDASDAAQVERSGHWVGLGGLGVAEGKSLGRSMDSWIFPGKS